MLSHATAFLLIIGTAVLASAQASSSADGTLSVNGHTYALKYAYAVPGEMGFDANAKDRWIFLVDTPLGPFVAEDRMTQRQLGEDGKLHGVYFHLNDTGQPDRAVMLYDPSWKPYPDKYIESQAVEFSATASGGKASGKISAKPLKVADLSVAFNCTFDVSLYRRPDPIATGDAANSTGPGKVVLASWQAIRKHDKAVLEKLVTDDFVSILQGPAGDTIMENLAEMTDPNSKILRVYQVGDVALIEAGSEHDTSQVHAVLVNGSWKLSQ